jgi:hypothetical protein
LIAEREWAGTTLPTELGLLSYNALARSWEGELHCETWRNPDRTEPRPPGITQSRLAPSFKAFTEAISAPEQSFYTKHRINEKLLSINNGEVIMIKRIRCFSET